MPTALAISPHLDDAVFSAGGTLAQLAGEGWRVVVATVFTASVPNPRGFALACQLDKGLSADVDYMALRRNEDASACAAIGAEPYWLSFAEAPHRGYHSAKDLFSGLRHDDPILDIIRPALSKLILALAPDRILSPQAIGAHVDHIALHEALRSCNQPRWLWTDFPYEIRSELRPSPFEAEFHELSKTQVRLTRDNIREKTNGAMAYASQLGFQFGGAEQAREIIATCQNVERFRILVA